MDEKELRALVKSCLMEIIGEVKNESREEVYVSRADAAKKLGKGRSTLWRWEKMGYLMPVLIGGRAMYRMSDILMLNADKKGGDNASPKAK